MIIGLLIIGILSYILFWFLRLFGKGSRLLLALFLVTLVLHAGAVLFIHYAEFYPFGGRQGDQLEYHAKALELAERFREGNFSIKEGEVKHYYPVLVGGFYAFVTESEAAAKLMNAWLVSVSVLLAYFLMQELGSSRKWAFLAGLGIALYPSYLYYGSLLLREAIVVVLVLLALLAVVKLIKQFSWSLFALLYGTVALLTDFRFYIGFALLSAVVVAVPIMVRHKRVYILPLLLVLGFLPQLSGSGYYGKDILFYYINPTEITHYREVAYTVDKGVVGSEPGGPNKEIVEKEKWGAATIVVKAHTDDPVLFARNSLVSGSFVSLGPFPWHLSQSRHLFILAETIPWMIAVFFIVKGVIRERRQWYLFAPIVIFSMAVFAALALFVDNFGVYTRIRIPAFIALLCLLPLAFQKPR